MYYINLQQIFYISASIDMVCRLFFKSFNLDKGKIMLIQK
jgi:hypothetical protein